MALERSAIPREFSDPRRFSRRFRTLLALVAVAAVSGPIGCVTAVANRPAATPAPLVAHHQDYAAVIAQSYLAGQPLPVPVARGLGADAGRAPADGPTFGDAPKPAAIPHTWLIPMGATVTTVPTGGTAHRTVETHRFLVGAASGPFVLIVPLVETSRGGPALGALPSLEPFVPDAGARSLDPLDWSAAYQTARPPDSVTERVGEWARAYVGDDRRQLLEITGDPRTGVEYVGLGTWKLAGDPTVGGLFTRADGDAATHVELALVAAKDPKVTTRIGFDLLVRHATEPLPEIVAWGPAGSALTLRAFENATPVTVDDAGRPVDATTSTTSAAGAMATAEAGDAG